MSWSRVELALDARARLGEGPVWDPEGARLVWVDILAGTVNTFRPEGGAVTTVSVGRHVSAVGLRRSGGLVLAVREGFAFLADGSLTAGPAPLRDVPGQRMNDGKCDPAGRFLAGSMTYDLTPGQARLYRLDPDGSVSVLLEGLGLSNGLDWSPVGDRFYLVDSLARRVDSFRYDLAEGRLADRCPLVSVDERDGYPDGLAVDADGCLWVALWGGGRVRRYTPRGDVDAELLVPTPLVTSCAFGGRDLGDLYITTAREGGGEGPPGPHAGAIFVARPGAGGCPAHRFAG